MNSLKPDRSYPVLPESNHLTKLQIIQNIITGFFPSLKVTIFSGEVLPERRQSAARGPHQDPVRQGGGRHPLCAGRPGRGQGGAHDPQRSRYRRRHLAGAEIYEL